MNADEQDSASPAPPAGAAGLRAPFGLIGMLLVVTAIEAGIQRLDRRLLPMTTATWRVASESATTRASDADLICVGDSLVKVGVVPALLDEAIGTRSYNLAVLGGLPHSSYVLLRRALESGARPRAVLIDAQASLLMWNTPRSNLREWAEIGRLGELAGIARAEGDPGFLILCLIQRQLTSARLRPELRRAILGYLTGRPAPAGPSEYEVLDRHSEANRGGFLAPLRADKALPDEHPEGRLPDAERAVYFPRTWHPRLPNLDYLHRTIRLATDRDIPVFFVLPPLHAGIQAELERRGLDARYTELVRRLSDGYPGLVVVDARHAGFPHNEFADSVHLDRTGAMAFTRGLARVIADRLGRPSGGPAWVEVPRYEPSADDPRFEDVEQSRLALSILGIARR